MSGSPARDAAAPGWDLRVCSWNIWELRGDLAALIDAGRDLAPDVLLLQEAPRFVLPGARLRWLADRIGLRVLLGGPGGRGLAVLVTDEVARQVIRRGTHAVAQRITDLSSTYPRGVAAVRLSVPGGGAVVLADVHLGLQEDNRIAHAQHLVDLVRGTRAPVVLGGDLNEEADGPARTVLGQVLTDPVSPAHTTFPAHDPHRRIDAVLHTPGVRVVDGFCPHGTAQVSAERLGGASDHLPTVLDVHVPSRPGPAR